MGRRAGLLNSLLETGVIATLTLMHSSIALANSYQVQAPLFVKWNSPVALLRTIGAKAADASRA